MSRLQLSFAFGYDNPRARPIIDGRVQPGGIDFIFTKSQMGELAWRQLHGHEFDVSELSLSSLIAARSRGDDSFVGLPIFCSRSFMHTRVIVTGPSGIEEPKQLIGKRIGVHEYQQTAALWSRGIWHHEFGVDPRDCHWYMERVPEESHGGATGFVPPPGVDFHYIPPESSIAEMLVTGELDASLMGTEIENGPRGELVNIHRGPRLTEGNDLHHLFRDRRAEGRRYFEKTGIFPINHGVVVSREVLDEHPWVGLNVCQAFMEAKELWAAEARANMQPFLDAGLIEASVPAWNTVDLYPYGVLQNEKTLETLLDYSHEQGLSARRMGVEDIFYEPTLQL